MRFLYSFEKLETWQIAKRLNKKIYLVTRSFPDEEKYSLTSEIRRASISISSNLAEGSARKSQKEKIRFVRIAYSSLMELFSQITLARELEFIEASDFDELLEEIQLLSNKINALAKAFSNK